jgi:hypothetical protein
MIDKYRCIKCKISYDVFWDDSSEIYYSGVEDTDEDVDDLTENQEPQHCPFCGTHVHDDMSEEFEE